VIKPAQDCQTMQDVRTAVDDLDQQLVRLLAQRQTYMSAAARIKQDRDKVYDQARIDDVLSKVKAHAVEQNLSTTIAESVWRELIKQSIAFEYKQWDHIAVKNNKI